MKKLGIILVILVVTGCASTRNTINRLQGDIAYFQDELVKYSVVLGEGDSVKALNVLANAKAMLSKAESASLIGDKIAEKKYLSALVDIMDLLPEPKAEK
ncbi:hypothetical protein KAR91_42065 [Candidatus Pacearchaeota archaeon]|nr:hypothetical protein [Candidatus Pacearchaeota archaeon]